MRDSGSSAASWLSLTSAGSPRAVGSAQGRLWRRAQDREASEWDGLLHAVRWVLRWGARPPASALSWEDGRRFLLDLRRHYPHLIERSEALWRAAGRPRDWAGYIDPAAPAFGLRILSVDRHGIHCVLPAGEPVTTEVDAGGEGVWMVRDVRLEGGRRTLGVAPPLWPAHLAGVNEAGLCGVVAVEAPLAPLDIRPASALAPAWPLLDQTLERCDRVERALRWCERRPGIGRGLFVFADATGACGALRFDGARREREDAGPSTRVAPPRSGLEIRVDPRRGALHLQAPSGDGRRYAIAVSPP